MPLTVLHAVVEEKDGMLRRELEIVHFAETRHQLDKLERC
jgi:hypothetical protein